MGALDVSVLLLRPLDGSNLGFVGAWDDMVNRGATFKGFMYRLNGHPWPKPETSATWFLQSRREGLFTSVARRQVVNYCAASLDPELPLGDRVLTPVLGMFNYSLPTCLEDATVATRDQCPEAFELRVSPT